MPMHSLEVGGKRLASSVLPCHQSSAFHSTRTFAQSAYPRQRRYPCACSPVRTSNVRPPAGFALRCPAGQPHDASRAIAASASSGNADRAPMPIPCLRNRCSRQFVQRGPRHQEIAISGRSSPPGAPIWIGTRPLHQLVHGRQLPDRSAARRALRSETKPSRSGKFSGVFGRRCRPAMTSRGDITGLTLAVVPGSSPGGRRPWPSIAPPADL